jgi:hypothetical protein
VGTLFQKQEVLSMSKKQNFHLRGERGQAFADLLREVSAEHLLCVSIDVSKYLFSATPLKGFGVNNEVEFET